MSRIDEIVDQLKQKLIEIDERIKETEIYQKISDKYNSLTPSGQKLARYSTAIILVFLLVFYPVSQIQFSGTLISEFEDKRNLIKDLFKTYRESNLTNVLPPAPESNELMMQIQNSLSSSQLLPNQILGVISAEPEGKMIPKNLVKHVVQVQLGQLNLRQIVDIGTQLANLSGAIKVKDVSIDASPEKNGYFNATYKIYAFNVPIVEDEPEIPKNKNNSKSVDE